MRIDSRAPPTILLADDNPFFARAVKRFLQSVSGTTVVGHVRNGLEALSTAREMKNPVASSGVSGHRIPKRKRPKGREFTRHD